MASPGPPHVVVPFIEIKCVFRLIPKEILKHIVSFGDVASNVLFASTSSSFREFVFTKCPCTWEDIDFGKISKTQAENLTDADLHSLLTNVKAVQVTTTRSIMGCTSIQGRGLSALCYSHCLEKVELRKTREEMETIGDTGLDDSTTHGRHWYLVEHGTHQRESSSLFSQWRTQTRQDSKAALRESNISIHS